MAIEYEKSENIKLLFEELNKNNVKYVLTKNIENELPDKLMTYKDIDILVMEKDKEVFHNVIRRVARKINHPYSERYGWKNLYNMPEFEFWRMFKGKELIVDVTYRLCCKSLMPNLWIPLDDYIQEYLWENRKFDMVNNWWVLDDNTQFVYLVVRSILDKNSFSERYKKEIIERKNNIDKLIVANMFEVIFFKFTPLLMEMIDNDNYGDIYRKYVSFADY